jgi:hypothetical protein
LRQGELLASLDLVGVLRHAAASHGCSAPNRIDPVTNAIVEATAPLLDDFEVARRAARVAIEAIAS